MDGRGRWRARRPEATALHEAVRSGFEVVAAEADEEVALPRWVRFEVERYLGCGVVRRGFVQVKCEACQRSELVAFSCKQRGLCPSCGARRSHEVAAYLGELLPEVAYRQWTLSAPYAVRWALVKHPRLLARMEQLLVRAVWLWQRKVARRLEYSRTLHGGAVGFRQYFGSSLQLIDQSRYPA